MVPGLPILCRAAPAVPGLDADGAPALALAFCLPGPEGAAASCSAPRTPLLHAATRRVPASLGCLARRLAAQQPQCLCLPGVPSPPQRARVAERTAALWPQVWSVVLLLQGQTPGVVTLGVYWSLLYAGTALVEQYL